LKIAGKGNEGAKFPGMHGGEKGGGVGKAPLSAIVEKKKKSVNNAIKFNESGQRKNIRKGRRRSSSREGDTSPVSGKEKKGGRSFSKGGK